MRHLTIEDMIELHFVPDETVRSIHISDCALCSERFDRLQEQLRSAAEAGFPILRSPPSSFWARQRLGIMHAIEEPDPGRSRPALEVARWAAVAALSLVLTAAVLSRAVPAGSSARSVDFPVVAAESAGLPALSEDLFHDLREINDPWNSELLRPYQEVVKWESWTSDPDQMGESAL